MVKLRLLELTDKKVLYEYYPEGNKEHPGIVGLDLETKERLFIKESEDDFDWMYAHYALTRVEAYAASGHFKEEGMQAWY